MHIGAYFSEPIELATGSFDFKLPGDKDYKVYVFIDADNNENLNSGEINQFVDDQQDYDSGDVFTLDIDQDFTVTLEDSYAWVPL